MEFQHPKAFEKATKVNVHHPTQMRQDAFWVKREALFSNIEKRTEELIRIAKASGH